MQGIEVVSLIAGLLLLTLALCAKPIERAVRRFRGEQRSRRRRRRLALEQRRFEEARRFRQSL